MLGKVHETVGSVQFILALEDVPVQEVRRVQFRLPIKAVLVHEEGEVQFHLSLGSSKYNK